MKKNNLIKSNKNNIPQPTIHRLSICHRCLELFCETKRGKKIDAISSSEISKITGISSDQIRKDLAYFGKFGRRGIGYPIKDLIKSLKAIFGSSKRWDIIVVGVGNLGEALLRYKGFQKRGFIIKAAFDNNSSKIGRKVNNVEIMHIDYMIDYIKEHKIKIGIITVPVKSAQKVANCMISAGIRSILNFAPISIKHPSYVNLNSIDISVELERMLFYLASSPEVDN
jgi:redox-sensing transcriptional repressor